MDVFWKLRPGWDDLDKLFNQKTLQRQYKKSPDGLIKKLITEPNKNINTNSMGY